ncbi:MAG: DUF3795 domain-containing protein, partial [Dehalococcoidales bacterium]|nr:DUF3795 domain-containing protein [Dehalococcoidales bacterium]
MDINYPEIGICGLSCRLCPRYQTDATSKCNGCKSADRMAAGCPFITCAIKNKEVEFCWDCRINESCDIWRRHRETGKKYDSFKSYQKLEDDIKFIKTQGVKAYDEQQRVRESLLLKLLNEFNEGRSRSYYCIAVTIMDADELIDSLTEATIKSGSLDVKDKTKVMHSLLDTIA